MFGSVLSLKGMILACGVAVLLYASLQGARGDTQIGRFASLDPSDEVDCNDKDNANWTSTIENYSKKIEARPADPDLLLNRGNAYSCVGRFAEAAADYAQALALKPSYARVYYARAINSAEIGDYSRAIADYSQAIALDPQYVRAFNNRGVSYLKSGDLDRAIADFGSAIGLRPDYADAYVNRGLAYAKKSQINLAFADLGQAIALNQNDVNAYINRGAIYMALERYSEAISDFDKVLAIDPKDVVALHNRCYSRAMANVDADQALSDCDRDLELRPNHANTFEARSLVHIRLQQYDAAIADADLCLGADSKDATCLLARGIGKLRKGDVAGGNDDINTAKSLSLSLVEFYARRGFTQ